MNLHAFINFVVRSWKLLYQARKHTEEVFIEVLNTRIIFKYNSNCFHSGKFWPWKNRLTAFLGLTLLYYIRTQSNRQLWKLCTNFQDRVIFEVPPCLDYWFDLTKSWHLDFRTEMHLVIALKFERSIWQNP